MDPLGILSVVRHPDGCYGLSFSEYHDQCPEHDHSEEASDIRSELSAHGLVAVSMREARRSELLSIAARV